MGSQHTGKGENGVTLLDDNPLNVSERGRQALALSNQWGAARTWKSRAADGLFAGVLFALGWAWLLGQNARVFERQPDHAVERLVADNVPVALPRQLKSAELGQLCKGGVPRWAEFWPGAINKSIAQCLSNAAYMDEARAQAVLHVWSADLQRRITVAQRWADEYDKTHPERRKALETQLHRIQGKAPTSIGIQREALADPFSGDGILRTPPQGQAGRQLREHAANTQAWLNELLADQATPVTERAARLGLLIAGKRIQRDFGKNPPVFYLNSDVNSLAERMEWHRRAQGHVENGLSLPRLQGLLMGVLLASVGLMLVVAWLGMAATPWALVSLLLGIGVLLVVDLGIAADAAFRSIAFRQWGGWLVPGTGLAVWWPLLAIAVLLVLVRHPTLSQSWPARVLGRWIDRFWVQWGHSPRWGWAQMVLLLAAGLGIFAAPLGGATKSELVIALGCVGLATFLAREAALASVGTGVWSDGMIRHWLRQELAYREQKVGKEVLVKVRARLWQTAVAYSVVAAALVVALGASISRGDLGHALVASGMAGVFFWLFSGRKLRGLLAMAFTLVVLLLAIIYVSQEVPPILESLIRSLLPYHAQERFLGMVHPLDVTASDMARVRWLMQSADAMGWGSGWVPWSGLGEVRLSDGVPLQGPSDYVPALLVAQWGAVPGAIILLTVLGLFVGGAVVAGRTALAQGVGQSVRLLAGIGLFGCVLMAFKVLLSLGGVTGVLPLTGLPVALVGYGFVSTVFGLGYLALAFGTRHHRVGRGVQLRSGLVLRGPLVDRGRALVMIAGVATVLLTLASLARMNAPTGGIPSNAACDPPVRQDINGQPIEVLAVTSDSAKRRAHCSGTAYRLTQALKEAVSTVPVAPTSNTAALSTEAPTPPPAVVQSVAVLDPAVNVEPSEEGFIDSEGGSISSFLEAQRQSIEVKPAQWVASGSQRTSVCPEMVNVLAAWNKRVGELQGKQATHLNTFDAQALFNSLDRFELGWQSPSVCAHRARELGILLQSSLPASLAAGGRPARDDARRFAAFFAPNASKVAMRSDFETPNAWRGLPGCIVPTNAIAADRTDRKCNAEDREARMVATTQAVDPAASSTGQAPKPATEPLERVALNNYWLQQQLAGRLGGVKSYSDESLEFEWRRHRVQAGPVVALTLEPKLQDLAQRIVECYTGQRRGSQACAGVLPANETHSKAYFGVAAKPGDSVRMRAGAMGMVLTEVDSGRVVAFANAISDCSLTALATRQPFTRSDPNRPVIGSIDPKSKDALTCSPWPDRRKSTEHLALQAPALWMVPPGSSLKTLVVMSGIQAGTIKPGERERWRTLLAISHDIGNPRMQNSVREAALSAGGAYRDTLRLVGFDLQPPPGVAQNRHYRDLLWGDPAGLAPNGEPVYGTRWTVLSEEIGHLVRINSALVPWRLPQNLSWQKYLAMQQEKKKKPPVAYAEMVREFGAEALEEYPYAQVLTNAAIGGGDMRVNAIGLADVWRSIDLRARGKDQKTALHLLETPGTPVPQLPLTLATPEAAEFAMFATSAVTDPQGTASTACKLVTGDCTRLKETRLHGKTGTSDFTQENTRLVKANLDVPAKLFGGVFEVQGKRYALAAVGLRVRNGSVLDGSAAPAEAALTLVREMQRGTASADTSFKP